MAVLITGATALLEGIDLSDYFTSDQIVITTEKLPSMPFVQKKGTSVQYAQVKADAPDINKLYDIYDFTDVIFLSSLLNPLSLGGSSYADLFRTLDAAEHAKVERIFVIFPDIDKLERKNTSRMHAMEMMRDVLQFFAEQYSLKVHIIYSPYLVNQEERNGFLRRLPHTATPSLPWDENMDIPFLPVQSFIEELRNQLEADVKEIESTLSPLFLVTFQNGFEKDSHFLSFEKRA